LDLSYKINFASQIGLSRFSYTGTRKVRTSKGSLLPNGKAFRFSEWQRVQQRVYFLNLFGVKVKGWGKSPPVCLATNAAR